jgi:protein-tyrosine phosphatase
VSGDRVAPRLWQGAAPDPAKPYTEFDVIVLCAQEVQPRFARFKGTVIRAPFADTPYPTSKERKIAIRAAREVVKHLRKHRRVLVTCAQGWNRSGLVVGLTLRMATNWHPEEIVRRIRAARGEFALSNPAFERIVRGFSRTRSDRAASRRPPPVRSR